MNKRKIIEKYKRASGMGQDLTGHGYHSAYYHRHFEGYSEYEAVDGRGRTRIKRVYTGVRYTPELDRRQRVGLKLAFTVVWLLAAGIFVFCATRRIGANTQWYTALVQFGIIIGLGWTAVGIFNWLTVPLARTVGDWRSSSQTLKSGSICAAACFILEALLNLLCLLLKTDAVGLQLLCILGYLLGALAAALINRLEANVTYTQTPSGGEAPRGASQID